MAPCIANNSTAPRRDSTLLSDPNIHNPAAQIPDDLLAMLFVVSARLAEAQMPERDYHQSEEDSHVEGLYVGGVLHVSSIAKAKSGVRVSFTVSAVCRRWRYVALACRRLWQTLPLFLGPSLADRRVFDATISYGQCIARYSRGAPLTIDLHVQHLLHLGLYDRAQATFQALAPCISHAHRLIASPPMVLCSILQTCPDLRSKVEHLTFRSVDTVDNVDGGAGINLVFPMSQIHTLCFENFWKPLAQFRQSDSGLWPWFPNQSLRKVTISIDNANIREDDIPLLLEGFPQLEDLSICAGGVEATLPGADATAHPALQLLTLDLGGHICSGLARRLHLPALRTLRQLGDCPGDDKVQVLQGLQAPALQTIHLSNLRAGRMLVQALQRFNALEVLTLEECVLHTEFLDGVAARRSNNHSAVVVVSRLDLLHCRRSNQ